MNGTWSFSSKLAPCSSVNVLQPAMMREARNSCKENLYFKFISSAIVNHGIEIQMKGSIDEAVTLKKECEKAILVVRWLLILFNRCAHRDDAFKSVFSER